MSGHNPWLVGFVVALAAFMEILDTSIANVALPHIAGNLGVSNDESTWVLTTYLVSNAIVLPITGWLAGTIGRKRFFVLCLAAFTGASFLCGLAPGLPVLLLARVLQGAGGGGLQPMAQAILADGFPAEQRGLAFSLYGVTAVIAPAIGPTLGGWITDNYSWRWIFLINLPVGLLTLMLVARLVNDPPRPARARAGIRFDYVGFALLVVGVGALQVLLDRGQEDDWFGSSFITTLVIVSAVALTALVIWEWRQREPIIDVRLFRNVNFASANLMMFMLGVTLFACVVLLPQFLQTLLDYPAKNAGMAISAGGLVLLVQMPLVGKLTSRMQTRYIIAVGWLILTVALAYSARHLDLFISFGWAAWLRVVQVLGLGFLFVPITVAVYAGMPSEKSNSVAGLINFMRNLGSSVGTSLVTTLVARRAQLHQVHLVTRVAPDNETFQDRVAGLTQQLAQAGLTAYEARRQAYARIYQAVLAQAQTLAYVDTFWLLTAMAAVMFAVSFLLQRNDPGKSEGPVAA